VSLIVDARTKRGPEGEVADGCRKSDCICKVKRENTLMENGETKVIGGSTSSWPAEKKELLREIA
jgi:hypothetical protein